MGNKSLNDVDWAQKLIESKLSLSMIEKAKTVLGKLTNTSDMIRSMSVNQHGLITDTCNIKLLQILKDKGVRLIHQFTPGIYEFD